MKSAPSPAAVSALTKVQKQFKHWRKTKTGRERIPDSLWQAAADVFHIGGYSLHKIFLKPFWTRNGFWGPVIWLATGSILAIQPDGERMKRTI